MITALFFASVSLAAPELPTSETSPSETGLPGDTTTASPPSESSNDTQTTTLQARATTSTSVTVDHRGLRVRSADGRYGIDLSAFGQLTYNHVVRDPDEAYLNGFDLRTLRPTVRLLLSSYAEFSLTLNVTTSTARAYDAALTLHAHPKLRFRMGIQKGLLNIEQTQSPTHTLFLERSMVSMLSPVRDIGIVAETNPTDSVLLEFGVYNGVNDNEITTGIRDDTLEVHARARYSPLLDLAPQTDAYLTLGVGGTTGAVRGTAAAPQLEPYRSSGKRSFILYAPDAVQWGRRSRATGFAYGGWRGLYAQAEVLSEAVGIRTAAHSGRLQMLAWQVAVAQTIGGTTSWKGTVPRRSLFDGGLGALQLKARAHSLSVRDRNEQFLLVEGTPASPVRYGRTSRATGMTLGTTWWLSRELRVQADYGMTVFDEGHGTHRLPTEHLIQLSTTFGM